MRAIILVLTTFMLPLLSASQEKNNLRVYINSKEIRSLDEGIQILIGDSIEMIAAETGDWYQIKPVAKEYNNLGSKVAPITYNCIKLNLYPKQTLQFIADSSGTFTYFFSLESFNRFTSSYPLISTLSNVVQIVIRKDNSFIGYCTELLGLPFVLPPKNVLNFGHQTDHRIGVDCAELAIYGRRRMGHRVPYCGPRGILEYLTESLDLKVGSIIHFGHQVSILYDDLGVLGELDGEDLLIHAFEDQVKIQPLGSTSLLRKPFRIFKWKDE